MRQRRSLQRRPRPSIRLKCFPADDPAFRTAARDAAASVPGTDPILIAERIRDRLAGRYRLVVVRPQDPLAADDGNEVVLYAFRDGAAVPSRAPLPVSPLSSRYGER